MGLNEFIAKHKGKFYEYTPAEAKKNPDTLNQCMDLYYAYVSEVLELPVQRLGMARDVFEKYEKYPRLYKLFDRIPNTLTFLPKEGDIAIWNGKYGPYGHIAICTGKSTLWNFEVFSQNDPLKSPCIFKTYKYKNFYGVLRPKHLLEEWIKANTSDSYDTWLKKLLNSLK